MGGVGTLNDPLVMQPVFPKNAPLMRMVKSMPCESCAGPVTMMSMLPAQAFPGKELSRKLPAPICEPLATVHGSQRAPVLVDVLVELDELVDVLVEVLVELVLVELVLVELDELVDVLVEVLVELEELVDVLVEVLEEEDVLDVQQ